MRFSLQLAPPALLAALALLSGPAAAEWVPEPLLQSGEWTAACDNAGLCTAVSVSEAHVRRLESTDPGDWATPRLWLRREAGPLARPRLFVDLTVWGEARPAGPLVLHVLYDGEPERLGPAYPLTELEPGRYELDPRQVDAFLAESRATDRAVTRRPDGSPHGLITTSGMVAALRWIDQQQGRAGTVTAIYGKGAKSARSVPRPEPRPDIRIVRGRGPGQAAAEVPVGFATRAEFLCGTLKPGQLRQAVVYVLADGHRLWAVPCGDDPVNPVTAWGLSDPKGRFIDFKLPRPDRGNRHDDPGLPNSRFDPVSGQLVAVQQLRSFGDCGWQRRWGWTGQGFAMIDSIEMPACIGIVRSQWLQTYRAVPL